MDQVDLEMKTSLTVLSKEEKIRKIMQKFVIGMYIGKSSGNVLYSYQIDPSINIELIPQFLSALSIFSEERIGKIKKIHVEGAKLQIMVISKHDLLLTVIFRPDMVQDFLVEEGEKGLSLFYEMYRENLEANHSNLEIFRGFDKVISEIIVDYLQRINAI